jgi:hypothetical protein
MIKGGVWGWKLWNPTALAASALRERPDGQMARFPHRSSDEITAKTACA